MLSQFGDKGAGVNQLHLPFYCATDHNDNIIISDNMNYCVKVRPSPSPSTPSPLSLTIPSGYCPDFDQLKPHFLIFSVLYYIHGSILVPILKNSFINRRRWKSGILVWQYLSAWQWSEAFVSCNHDHACWAFILIAWASVLRWVLDIFPKDENSKIPIT